MEEARGEAEGRLGRERAGEVTLIDAGEAYNEHRTRGVRRQDSVRKVDDLWAFCIVTKWKDSVSPQEDPDLP